MANPFCLPSPPESPSLSCAQLSAGPVNTVANSPTVSVVIPVLNGEPFLRQCLDSALAQTRRPLEIVVVNDGSTDGTAEILRNYQGRATVLEQESRGQSAAVNRAVAHSRGELVAFLDCDDCWDPIKLERQVAVLERFPEAVAVYCDHRRIDASGTITGRTGALAHPRTSGQVLGALIRGNFIISPSVMMIRAKAFHAAGGFDEATPDLGSKDYGLWLRLATLGPFIYLAETLASYRQHANNMSARLGFRRIVCDLAALQALDPFLKQSDKRIRVDYNQQIFDLTLGAAWHCATGGHRMDSLRYYFRALRMKPLSLPIWLKAALALTPLRPSRGRDG